MRIDLSSPVELWHCRIPTPDDPVLTMQIYNMSDKDVRSIQVCVHCYDAEGDQYARHVERLQGIDGPGRHVFEASLEVEEAEYAQFSKAEYILSLNNSPHSLYSPLYGKT